jgi:hypothetical protein
VRFLRLSVPVVSSAAALLFAPAIIASTPVAAVAPIIVHGTRVPVSVPGVAGGSVRSTWAASNWSGYAETGAFTGVSGTWTVPAVSATSSATYSSAWIGVDGFNDSSLIQTGTEEDYYSGAAHYDAWWEILPAAETEISPSAYPVAPGDAMRASIYETSATTTAGSGFFGRHKSTEHVWTITISDTTKNWSFTTNQGYNGAGSSAEWVLEAPEVNGRIATLAHYTITPAAGVGDFDNAGILTSVVSSGTPTYANAALNYANDSGVMIQNGAQVSTPGDPDGALTAFNVAYGSSLPPTPSG